jgi:hypothetical protein
MLIDDCEIGVLLLRLSPLQCVGKPYWDNWRIKYSQKADSGVKHANKSYTSRTKKTKFHRQYLVALVAGPAVSSV